MPYKQKLSFDEVKAAREVIQKHIHNTPILTCSTINNLAKRNIHLKCENFQKTGSFKIRGAIYAVHEQLQKDPLLSTKGVVTHSSGNHGQALAHAGALLGIPVTIVMPATAPKVKKAAVRGYGGNIVECEPTMVARDAVGKKVLAETGGHFIHPNQDSSVIAGQGTLSLELLDALPDLDAIVAPVGGGGLVAGIALAAKAIKPGIKVYAAEPEQADDCYLSMKAGKLIPSTETPTTVADGVRAGVGEVTWPLIRDLVDDVILVSEQEIKDAVLLVWERAKLVVEPTAGCGIAAVINTDKFSKLNGMSDDVKNVAVILCGGNCDIVKVAEFCPCE